MLAASLFPMSATAAESESLQPKRTNTWSVVAADPKTGDVGVAAASCVPVHMSDLAALVPGKGASVAQSSYLPRNREKNFASLKAGADANEVVDQVLRGDKEAKSRQYGVVTLAPQGAAIKAFTGKGNDDWAGSKSSDKTFPVTAQGNTLVGSRVVTDAIEAFDEAAAGDLTLSDRLMRALEAGSAAGGDKRCNTTKGEQTAASAFIMVARGKDAPYATSEAGVNLSKTTKEKPFLALSVLERAGGPNPLIALRGEYDDWRNANLPECPGCDLSAVKVPVGGAEPAGDSSPAASDTAGSDPESGSPESGSEAGASEKAGEDTSGDGVSAGSIAGGAAIVALVAAAWVFVRRRSS